MNLGSFFFMLLSFTGAVVVVVSVIAYHVKRLPSRSAGQLSPEELDDIRARLTELEQRDLRVEELEERLDFVERALGRAREAPSLRNPSQK